MQLYQVEVLLTYDTTYMIKKTKIMQGESKRNGNRDISQEVSDPTNVHAAAARPPIALPATTTDSPRRGHPF